MVSVTLKGIISADRQLAITLPDDLPTGAVAVTITALPIAPAIAPGGELTRERLRALLAAEGALSTTRYAPPDATPLTDEEREKLGQLFAGEPNASAMIIKDRREQWD